MLLVRIGLFPLVLLAAILAAGCATPQFPEPLATAENAGSWADAYQAASVSPPATGAATASLQKTFSSLTDAFRSCSRGSRNGPLEPGQPTPTCRCGSALSCRAGLRKPGQSRRGHDLLSEDAAGRPQRLSDTVELWPVARRQGSSDKPRLTTSVRLPRSQVIPRPGTTWDCATPETGIPNLCRPPWKNAAAAQPPYPLYRNNLAAVLVDLQRYDEALRHLAAVHAASVAHYNLGFLLAERHQTARAAGVCGGAAV